MSKSKDTQVSRMYCISIMNQKQTNSSSSWVSLTEYRPLAPLAVGTQSQSLSNDAPTAMAAHVFAGRAVPRPTSRVCMCASWSSPCSWSFRTCRKWSRQPLVVGPPRVRCAPPSGVLSHMSSVRVVVEPVQPVVAMACGESIVILITSHQEQTGSTKTQRLLSDFQ